MILILTNKIECEESEINQPTINDISVLFVCDATVCDTE